MGAIVVPDLFLFHMRITQLITTHNIRPIGRSQLDIFVFNTPIGNTSLFSFVNVPGKLMPTCLSTTPRQDTADARHCSLSTTLIHGPVFMH